MLRIATRPLSTSPRTILIKSLNEILVSVLRSHRDYMVDWFEVCTMRGTEINFDL